MAYYSSIFIATASITVLQFGQINKRVRQSAVE